jgi:serpin B
MRLVDKLAVVLVCTLLVVGGTAYYFFGRAPGEQRAPLARADDTGSTYEGLANITDATNMFAFEMYANLSASGGNVFFSPYSMEAAFAMLYEGARGKTADEIRAVFHFTKDDQLRRSSFAAFYNAYNPESLEYRLSTANAVWVQKNYTVLAEYLDVLTRYYMASAQNVDFVCATEQARKTINDWVAAHTGGKITELFPEGSIDDGTVLALTNAIYFKGTWVTKFDSSRTETADFHLDPNRTVRVRMMETPTNGDIKFKYANARTDGLEILKMPYNGNRLSMLILLPKGYSTAGLETMLSQANLTRWRSLLRSEEIEVLMPKFEFRCTYDLKETLIRMGMPSAFMGADLSGIDGGNELFVQTAVHQAYIKVNEEGTEAAAATGGAVAGGIPPLFNANHPFVFLIQDDKTGNILFMGKVADPTK